MYIKKIFQEQKPWGESLRFIHNQKATVQLLHIRKGEELSLHFHKDRDDEWYIVRGVIEATLGTKSIQLNAGDSLRIPKGTKHNACAIAGDATILEIAVDDFDILDTIRVSDKYGRV